MSERYGVILADPPWEYRNCGGAALRGAAAHHYDTMHDSVIAKIPVASWAAEDCVLACWATWPKLREAMGVVEAWGFDYVTAIPWIKVVPSSGEIRRGVGFWAMSASEVLLIARIGDPKRLNVNGGEGKPIGLLVGEDLIFYAPIREHSSKPLEVHEWLEDTLHGPNLELFARVATPGWTCWGRELGVELTSDGRRPCEIPVVETPQRSLFA